MAYLLASTFSTLMIMAGLMEMAMPVSATDVVAAVWFDWLGLAGLVFAVSGDRVSYCAAGGGAITRSTGLSAPPYLRPCGLCGFDRHSFDLGSNPRTDWLCCREDHLWFTGTGGGRGSGRVALCKFIWSKSMTEAQYFQQGIAELQAGRTAEALAIFQQAVASNVATSAVLVWVCHWQH